ncbi:MAG: sensor histidine kinase [bacterium]|nr:sensor histidine kinase [bacterium]
MHPILKERARLGLYLGAWLPIAALVAMLLVLTVRSSWVEAIALALPLVLVYAFLCLAAWYPCRALPLQRASLTRVLGTHLGAAIASSILWVGLAVGLGQVFERFPTFAGVGDRIRAGTFLLLAFGVLLYLLSVAVHYLMVAFEASREAEKRALRAELGAKEAELHALRTQLDPHFIFNSLNSVSSLVTSDAKAARQMCVQLGEFLRDSLRLGRRTTISLADEMAMVTRYLAVEQVRYGSRLEVKQEVEAETEDCLVPPLLLQPLVENALKHGINRIVEGGTLLVEAHREERLLRLIVENPLDPDATGQPSKGAGIGLDNVQRRLRSLYGNRARLKVQEDAEKNSFRVEVILPAVTERSTDDEQE